MFLASLSPSAVMIELCLVFGGFERMMTSLSCSWIWWFSPTFSVSMDIDVRPCSVMKRPKGHSYLKLLQPTSPYWLWVQSVAWLSELWMFWQMPFETANNEAAMSLNQGAHTRIRSLGQARRLHGWALSRTSSHPPFLLWKLYRKVAKAVLSIHAIFDSRYWNSVKGYFAKGL